MSIVYRKAMRPTSPVHSKVRARALSGIVDWHWRVFRTMFGRDLEWWLYPITTNASFYRGTVHTPLCTRTRARVILPNRHTIVYGSTNQMICVDRIFIFSECQNNKILIGEYQAITINGYPNPIQAYFNYTPKGPSKEPASTRRRYQEVIHGKGCRTQCQSRAFKTLKYNIDSLIRRSRFLRVHIMGPILSAFVNPWFMKKRMSTFMVTNNSNL